MKVAIVGLDIAKQVFQVHGADRMGWALLRRKLRRNEVIRFFSELEPCLVGIEASGSAHYWARVLEGVGRTVRLMAPQFVKPYVKSQKNDANDAEAICEAVTRPNMRFVPQKSVEQQARNTCCIIWLAMPIASPSPTIACSRSQLLRSASAGRTTPTTAGSAP